ncbi:MAG: tripartite tricarboxylate transporter substrate-binding protein, partial [Burkholderiales bacterium]
MSRARMKALLFAMLVSGQALAQYPSKPVRLVVGFAPGGAADFVARTLQDPMQRSLGQPIVIDNKPGAGSSIAAEQVAK